MVNILEMANCRVKWSEIWDSGVLMERVWGIFDLAAFKVIQGSLGALTIFWGYYFQIAASSTVLIVCQPKFYRCVS